MKVDEDVPAGENPENDPAVAEKFLQRGVAHVWIPFPVKGKLHRDSQPATDAEKAQRQRLTLPAEGSGVNCIPFLVEFDDHFKL
jgi:hypothetical protein